MFHSVIQSKHANALHGSQLVFSPLKVTELSGKVKVELLWSAVVFRSMSLYCYAMFLRDGDDGDWWMDEHQVMHASATVHMPQLTLYIC